MNTRSFIANVVTSSLPSWVPSPGNVNILTTNNGITNTFASQVDVYMLAYYSSKIITDYSGGVVNPHYGTYGATVFDGAGHSASNDNMTIQLEYNASNISWRKIVKGSPLYGNQVSNATDNSLSSLAGKISTDWVEYTVDSKPGSRHSYGCSDIVGPADGGAAYGTFYRTWMGAVGQGGLNAPANFQTSFVPHKIAFGSVGLAEYTYQRAGTIAPFNYTMSMAWSQYVSKRNKIYTMGHNVANIMVVFDVATGIYSSQADTLSPNSDAIGGQGTDGYGFAYVPERDLLFYFDSYGSKVRLRWASVPAGSSTLPWNDTGVVLNIPAQVGWGQCCWCPDSSRLLIGTSLDNTHIYEVVIPTLTGGAADNNPANWVTTTHVVPAFPFHDLGFGGAYGYKMWGYNPKTKTIAYIGLFDKNTPNSESIYVYRPRNT